MKIISWNCGGKFREKYKLLQKVDADIYVVQECEDPEKSSNVEYKNFASNFVWLGDNKNKGLGIFAKDNVEIYDNKWNALCLRNFISLRVNGVFNLLAVWACKPYIEEYYIYQYFNKDKYDKKMLIIGDFNSNSNWDYKHHKRNHSLVVRDLEQLGLVSAYHFFYNECQGQESKKTFCLYGNKNRGYHIDYAFASKQRIKFFEILDNEEWLAYSDHYPILVEID